MRNSRIRNWLRRRTLLIVAVILLMGALVLLARSIAYQSIHQSERSALERSGEILRKEILSYVYGLQGMAGIVYTHDFHPSLPRVKEYAILRDNFKNFAGAMGFGFIRRVPRSELPSYLKRIRLQKPDFKIKQLSDFTGDHFIIEFIEPFEQNSLAQGLDVATEPFRKQAALAAWRTRSPTLTAPIHLVQSSNEGSGFLFFHPLFDKSTTPERLIGWAYAPILTEQLLKQLALTGDERLQFSIMDVTLSSRPAEVFVSDKIKRMQVAVEYSTKFNVAGRVWEVKAGVSDQSYHTFIDVVALLSFLALIASSAGLVSFIDELIDRRNDTSRKLGEVKSWQQAVLDSAVYSIISTDTVGVIQTFNRGAEALLGYTSSEVVGIRTPQLFHVEAEVVDVAKQLSLELGYHVEPGFASFVEKTRITGTSDIRNWTYVRKDGVKVPIRLCVTAVRSSSDTIVGYLGIAEDISMINELQSVVELQKTNLLNSAKMSALGEMAGGIAHEINNPLAILEARMSLIQLKLSETDCDKAWLKQEITKLQSTIHRIAAIVLGLRSFSRDGTNDPKVPMLVGQVIEETLSLCNQRFQNHGVRIDVQGKLDATLVCRPVQISQVLMNLLNNSFDALRDSEDRWITIEVNHSPKVLRIIVTDSGVGIHQDVAAKMLQPFFTTKDVGKGTGLGLSISAGIMTAHGGKLIYNSLSPHTQFILEFAHA